MLIEAALGQVNKIYNTNIHSGSPQSMRDMGINETLEDRSYGYELADHLRKLRLALLFAELDNSDSSFPDDLEGCVSVATFSKLTKHEHYYYFDDPSKFHVKLMLSEPGMFVFHQDKLDRVKFKVITLPD